MQSPWSLVAALPEHYLLRENMHDEALHDYVTCICRRLG